MGHKVSQAQVLSADGWDEEWVTTQQGEEAGGAYLLSNHPFAPVFLFPLQNNILVVKDDSNHPMSVVSSTKSRWVK